MRRSIASTILCFFLLVVTLTFPSKTNLALANSESVQTVVITGWVGDWEIFAKELQELKQIGVDAIETDVGWDVVEPQKGVFSWTHYDDFFRTVEEAGLLMVPIISVHYVPSWVWTKYPDSRLVNEFNESSDQYMSYWHPQTRPLIENIISRFFARYRTRSFASVYVSLGMWGELHYPHNPRFAYYGYDQNAESSFREEMILKYATIENANELWGTSFYDWTEVRPPLPDTPYPNMWNDFLTTYNSTLVEFEDWALHTIHSYYNGSICAKVSMSPDEGEEIKLGHIDRQAIFSTLTKYNATATCTWVEEYVVSSKFSDLSNEFHLPLWGENANQGANLNEALANLREGNYSTFCYIRIDDLFDASGNPTPRFSDLSSFIEDWEHPYILVPDDYPTIQEAINNADEGDTILVRSGMYYEHVVVNKTVSLIGEDSTVLNGTTVEPMMIVEANGVKIVGFTLVGWAFQNIVINSTNGVIITENRIVFNAIGIDVENSVNITIESNIIDGFGLDNIGIAFFNSSQCKMVNNTITNAVYFGIRLWFSDSNLITKNLIKGNNCGIDFYESEQNTISENLLLDSGGPGIYIDSSSNNYFFHDSFIGNYNHVLIFDNSANIWDNGVEGNYWSNYTSTDSDGDGIGDVPHLIKGSNQDNCPLMSPYLPGDINHDVLVDIFDIANIAVAFGSTPLDSNWNPHCDVNQDNAIDIFDLVVVAVNFGKEWTPP